MLAGVEVVDVGPVGHGHSVPLELLFRPFCQVLMARVDRHAVDGCRVDHHGQCSCLHAILEWPEIFFPQVVRCNVCRCPVFTGSCSSVAEIMLDAYRYVFQSYVVRVSSLGANHFRYGHF